MTSRHVTDEIKEWKERHKSSSMSQSDMLWYIMARGDKMDTKLDDVRKQLTDHIATANTADGEIRGKVSLHSKLITTLIAGFIAVAGTVAATLLNN